MASYYKIVGEYYNSNKSAFPMDLKQFIDLFEMNGIGFHPYERNGQPEFYKGAGGLYQTLENGKAFQVLKFVDSTGHIFADVSSHVARMYWQNGGAEGKDWSEGKKFHIVASEWTKDEKSGVNVTLCIKPDVLSFGVCL